MRTKKGFVTSVLFREEEEGKRSDRVRDIKRRSFGFTTCMIVEGYGIDKERPKEEMSVNTSVLFVGTPPARFPYHTVSLFI